MHTSARINKITFSQQRYLYQKLSLATRPGGVAWLRHRGTDDAEKHLITSRD